ncbi:MAG: CvpA family protein [Clostridia bacterium]|nr:CvpA family protein [Clostridia bacterium]
MSFIIDIIIILTAVAAVYLGIIRGFVKSVMGFISLLLAIVAAYIFTGPVSGWINEKLVGDWVSGIVDESLTGIVSAGTEQLDLSKLLADRPEALESIAGQFGYTLDDIDEYYGESLSGMMDGEALSELSKHIADPTAEAISTVAAAIGVFLAALLVLKLITFIFDMICRLPILDTLNTLLGLLFGIGSAVVLAWVISNLAVGALSALNAIDAAMFNQSVIENSIVLRFFYNNSLILFK